jgi:hypothetical protein
MLVWYLSVYFIKKKKENSKNCSFLSLKISSEEKLPILISPVFVPDFFCSNLLCACFVHEPEEGTSGP